MRNLILILGDQLDPASSVFDDFDKTVDAVWMAEVDDEASYVNSHKQRLVFFFSSMRHFRDELLEKNYTVHYHELNVDKRRDSGRGFADVLQASVRKLNPEKLIVAYPGDFRVKRLLQRCAEDQYLELEIREDRHFYCTPQQFAEFADGRKSLLLETFYRKMRKDHDVLITQEGQPEGGEWNFDKDNRETFSKNGPGKITGPHAFRMDNLTESVCDLVEQRFANHPGSLEEFCLPVSRSQANQMLRDFVDRSLPLFGKYEDAMWTDEAFVYHSRLSAALNVKMLDAKACVEKAAEAYHSGNAPINSVEGFIRQILGWREFIRGVYWLHMPAYSKKNFLRHRGDVPSLFWDGETDMKCVSQSMQHVLKHGYAHHIHRLMVLGNLALLLGVHPKKFHDWHMAMYVDAIDWVSLPNALGMSQHGDGGIVGTKPYISTGNYINKMSNFCKACPYDYRKASGENACPFTSLYWDFLDRHESQFEDNNRMALQLKNLAKKRDSGEFNDILTTARRIKRRVRSSES